MLFSLNFSFMNSVFKTVDKTFTIYLEYFLFIQGWCKFLLTTVINDLVIMGLLCKNIPDQV